MSQLQHTESIDIAATPEQVYAVVSDVTRTGQWSPTCVGCEWVDGAGPSVGSWFVGHNRTAEREWDTRSQVTAATPGREFAWAVGGNLVAWGYAMSAVDGGTRLTESWQVLPGGLEFFDTKYGDDAAAQLEQRRQSAVNDIPKTLATIKQIVESGA